MKLDNNKLFIKKISDSKSDFINSFVDEKISVTNQQLLNVLADYIGKTIFSSSALPSRRLYLSRVDDKDINITFHKPSDMKESEIRTEVFYPFLIQSSLGLFLIVVSKFGLYDVLTKEPYIETIGEYQFQHKLGKALGLKNAIAYDSNRKIDENEIQKNDLELVYRSDSEFSYLVFFL